MVHTMPSNRPMIAAIAKALRNRRRKAGLGGFLAFPLIEGSHIATVLVEPLRHRSSLPSLQPSWQDRSDRSTARENGTRQAWDQERAERKRGDDDDRLHTI